MGSNHVASLRVSNLDSACTPDIVNALQSEVLTLRREKESLQAQLQAASPRHALGAPLVAALVQWFLAVPEDLVFDDGTEPPISIHSAIEEPSRFAGTVSKHVAAALIAALSGRSPLGNLRLRCCGCGGVSCHGCGGYSTEITLPQIPVKVSALMGEVRRG